MKPIITYLGIAFFFYFFIGCEDPLYNSTSNNHFRVGGKTTVISSAAPPGIKNGYKENG